MRQKDVALDLPFSTFFEVAIFCGICVDFGLTFGAPLAPFGVILVSFWLKLGPFWCHVGPDFGYFAPSGQKTTPALTWHQISCKFFACKLSSLGPGAELLPQATEIDLRKRSRKGRQKGLPPTFWEVILEPFSIKNQRTNRCENRC